MIADYRIRPETRMNLLWIAIEWVEDVKTLEQYMERFISSHNHRSDQIYYQDFIQLVKYIGAAVDLFQDMSHTEKRKYNKLLS